MKRQLSQFVVCALTLFTALAGSTPASADDYRRINRLARRIDNTAALIVRESTNFVSSPLYNCLVNETHELRQLACHVRDIARAGCDLQHLRNDVVALGNAYRSLDAGLCSIEQANPGCHRARRLRRLLDSVQRDIYQMVSALNCLLNSVVQPQVLPGYGYGYGSVPVTSAWDYQYQNSGYGTGNGQGYGTGYGLGHGIGVGMGHPHVRGNLSHNEVRYPTVPSVQHQAIQRSASLEGQLRSMRSQQGGGRLSISF